MTRVVGLDIGEKRIGVAVSDELLITAQPADTIKVDSVENAKLKIGKIAERYKPCKLVIGFPKNMDGKSGAQAKKIIDLTEELKKTLKIEIELWDERLTTVSANKILLEEDYSRKKRKEKVDSLAASIMLQNYLEANR